MKRKYYLRGLGIGILITAIVFIIAGPSELSDDEIIKRAKELGYIKAGEQVTPSIGIKELLENTPIPTPTATMAPQETLTPEPTSTPMPEPTSTPTPEPTATPTPETTSTPTPEPTATPTPTPTETPAPTQAVTPDTEVITATIVVERGNTATVVCNKVEAAGIIEDAKVLRKYLIDNQLTDYINIGSYTLSSDMSMKEIAEVLTKH